MVSTARGRRPMSARIAVECRLQVFGVLGAIHTTGGTCECCLRRDQHQLGVEKRRRVIGAARAGRGKAARFKIVSTLWPRAPQPSFPPGQHERPVLLDGSLAVPDSVRIGGIGQHGTGPGGPGGGAPRPLRQSEPRPALTPTQRQAESN